MREKPHRAWVVLAGMMLIYAGLIGIMTNCVGVVFSAVIRDMEFRAGDLSLYYLIRAICMAAAMGVTAKLFFRGNARLVMAGLGALYCLAFGAMAFFHSLWQWYLAAAVAGVSMSCAMVVIPIVLNKWFHEKNGLVIGLTMSASGIAGALFSPLCSGMILAMGWRTTCLVMAGLGVCLIVLPSLFLIESSPEKAGTTPYGARSGTAPEEKGEAGPLPASREKGAGVFVLCTLMVVLAGNMVQFNNQLPTFAQTVGYSLTVGAVLTSCSMIGNLLGKLLLGVLTDRIGIYRSVGIFLGVQICALASFLLLSGSPLFLYAGAFFYGTIYAVNVTTPSLLLLDVYGPKSYGKKVSRLQAINGVMGALLSAAFPYVYDLTGSFDPVFLYGIAACAVSLLLCRVLHRRSNERLKTV